MVSEEKEKEISVKADIDLSRNRCSRWFLKTPLYTKYENFKNETILFLKQKFMHIRQIV